MKTSGKRPPRDEELRKRAEAQVRGDVPAADTSLSEVSPQALLHELQVHQIELELQNEELLLTQAEVKAALDQYRDLYDYAPVGYFSFDRDGSIQKVNLTGAALLMIERLRLFGRRFPLFLTNKTRGAFTACLERVFQTTIRQECEVALHMEGGQPVYVRIRAEASEDGQLCLAVVSDITESRHLAENLQNAHDKLEVTVQERTRELTSMNMQLTQEIAERRRAEEIALKSAQRVKLMERIGTIFLTVSDEDVYGKVLDVVLEVMESKYGIFGFIADNGDLLIPSMTREVWDACRIPNKSIVFPPDTWGKSLWGRAIREKTSFYANETLHTPEGHVPIDNFLAVPIIFDDKTIGLLSVGNKEGGYGDEDKELQEVIAARISPILNARQQRDRQEQKRRQAEEDLHKAIDYNRSLIEASLDPLVAISPAGMITDVNAAMEKITGYLRNDLIGHKFTDYFTEPEKARSAYKKVFKNGTVHDYELDVWHTDGHITPVLYNASVFKDQVGDIVGVFAALRDMSAYNQAQDELLKLSLAIEQSPVSIIITDIRGRIEFVNPKFTAMTGYTFEEVQGRNPRILKSGSTPLETYQNLWSTILSGNTWQGELKNRKKSDELFIEKATISPLKNKEGKITHFLAIKEDITEKKTLEAQLLQAQKMEAIGQLAGGIAHDFNNALTVIIGFTKLMEMHMDKIDPLRENISHILAAADKATDLTSSLLAFSRKQIMNLQPVDLNQIIENIEKFLHRIIGEDIAIKMIIHRDVLPVNADSGQIEQVFMNLAVNARDAMPHGGTLTIETDYTLMDAGFNKSHGYGEAGEYALITITDSGTGMDKVTLKKLFEPFFTTKELGKGTGLGLSIVYGIVKQHNGFIDVDSETGVGTTFTIYLPLTKADIKGKISHPDELPKMGTETILVADDDASILELTVKFLEQFGYTVLSAKDGLDAVNIFSENKEKIALVILDVMLPNMNGKKALDEIRKICPDMKAIFISGYTADIIHSRGMLDESLEYIAKPLKFMKFLQKVREVLDGKKKNVKGGGDS